MPKPSKPPAPPVFPAIIPMSAAEWRVTVNRSTGTIIPTASATGWRFAVPVLPESVGGYCYTPLAGSLAGKKLRVEFAVECEGVPQLVPADPLELPPCDLALCMHRIDAYGNADWNNPDHRFYGHPERLLNLGDSVLEIELRPELWSNANGRYATDNATLRAAYDALVTGLRRVCVCVSGASFSAHCIARKAGSPPVSVNVRNVAVL